MSNPITFYDYPENWKISVRQFSDLTDEDIEAILTAAFEPDGDIPFRIEWMQVADRTRSYQVAGLFECNHPRHRDRVLCFTINANSLLMFEIPGQYLPIERIHLVSKLINQVNKNHRDFINDQCGRSMRHRNISSAHPA